MRAQPWMLAIGAAGAAADEPLVGAAVGAWPAPGPALWPVVADDLEDQLG